MRDARFAELLDRIHAATHGNGEAARNAGAQLGALIDARALPLAAGDGRMLLAARGSTPPVLVRESHGWDVAGTSFAPLIGTDLFTLVVECPRTPERYRLRAGPYWYNDPANVCFAYDDHPGNADGRVSVFAGQHDPAGRLVDAGFVDGSGPYRRPATAWLPPGARSGDRLPLLLLHDGQNVFDDPRSGSGHGGWWIHRTAAALMAEGAAAPFVALGIHAGTDRLWEYGAGGQADYAAALIDRMLPEAAARLPIDTDRRIVVAGASMGGYIAAHLAYTRPDVFGAAACLSPSFWVGREYGLTFARLVRTRGPAPVRFYIDHGDFGVGGADGAAATIEVVEALTAAGCRRFDWRDEPVPDRAAALLYHHAPGADHNEAWWRKRAWRIVKAFFSPEGGL